MPTFIFSEIWSCPTSLWSRKNYAGQSSCKAVKGRLLVKARPFHSVSYSYGDEMNPNPKINPVLLHSIYFYCIYFLFLRWATIHPSLLVTVNPKSSPSGKVGQDTINNLITLHRHALLACWRLLSVSWRNPRGRRGVLCNVSPLWNYVKWICILCTVALTFRGHKNTKNGFNSTTGSRRGYWCTLALSRILSLLAFRRQMEKQVLGEIYGNPASRDGECHVTQVNQSGIVLSAPA